MQFDILYDGLNRLYDQNGAIARLGIGWHF